MCVYNPVRVGWVMDSRGEEPEAWCWSPQVQAQRWHWGRPHPPNTTLGSSSSLLWWPVGRSVLWPCPALEDLPPPTPSQGLVRGTV